MAVMWTAFTTLVLAAALALIARGVAYATMDVPPGVSQAQLDALAAQIPAPYGSVPAIETVAGAPGTAGTYRPGNAVQPRITRATTVNTVSGGGFSGTWATALPSNPNIVLTPIYSGTGIASCVLTAAPTTTTFAGKCTTDASALLNLSIITAGLTIGPVASSAGMAVQVLAIPPTQ